MKIRIKGDSIRFRLTKTEVETFCSTGVFSETTHFGNSEFTYKLQAKDGITSMEAEFSNNTITLFVPKYECSNWATSDKVGYQNMMSLKNSKELSLLLEKDFACLDNTTEDQSDNYPNPKVGDVC
ncbi:DUF7009 family protein [Flagellimonas zhangzhouensis]|uniref:Uncharacterized protein n=1 Tax=Flagellimonas zhangzhouensis TaxID=1073328 RepID=A0A1H2YKH1_9FLAO|nr:hypothetical protein [Allomuricauda zhangzhouensis]SDR02539.1 hypothetical protein SAMN05216294_3192 [Allomuricauda zhangzhouensis]SDX05298.1 hypothetical protein SAMN04487892_3073 [Allomuricauda zhangzhouensis]